MQQFLQIFSDVIEDQYPYEFDDDNAHNEDIARINV